MAKKGSTAYMRYTTIKDILRNTHLVHLIDTSSVLRHHNWIINSLGFRFKLGPMIATINDQIANNLPHESYDFIWVDKAMLIKPATIRQLRARTRQLLHYTPDPAFLYNDSIFFRKSVSLFDYCITTKSYELKYYRRENAKEVLYCTQGYDGQIHFPRHTAEVKAGVAFIGRHESNRERLIRLLLAANIPIKLGGPRWNSFARRHARNKNLTYYGDAIPGTEYAEIISSAQIGLGFLSELIPEKHTTRTFEIPACGTLLATVRTEETLAFFTEEEVLFYSSDEELLEKVQAALKNSRALREMTLSGYVRVTNGGYNYKRILSTLLRKTIGECVEID